MSCLSRRCAGLALAIGSCLLAGAALGAAPAAKPRVLFVNSYHAGYAWSDGIEQAVLDTLGVKGPPNGPLDASASAVEIRFFRMDTKRKPAAEQVRAAVEEARNLIDQWRPAVVIASDDNASKHLIAPYYLGAELPFVFCGVNWDAGPYGFPAANVTGMVEVQLIGPLLDVLRPYARGDRVAFLKGDDVSARAEANAFEEAFDLVLDRHFVTTFEQWREQYLLLQDEVDLLLLGNPVSVRGWDGDTALALILDHSRIPSGNWDAWMAPYALVSFATVPAEQGEWAAHTALRILAGTPPGEIPVVRNQKARVLLHMGLAKKLGIKFPMELIERATFVEEAGPGDRSERLE